MSLRLFDKEVYDALIQEKNRQNDELVLIASENYVSKYTLETAGSVLTNKYAEGYPDHRFYGGCIYIDKIERLACNRAKQIFQADHVNVQPHSGSQANLAVYLAILKPGDKVLGMSLNHGGHLTHGCSVNISGKYYKFFSYGVDKETERIDYDEVRKIAIKEKPKLIIAGASAYSRIINFKAFRDIANEVEAFFMVDMAHIAGLVAAGIHPSPVPYADVITSTTHKTLRGPRGGLILCKRNLSNKIDKAVFPAVQGGPLMHIIAAKAVSFKEAMTREFVQYQRQVVENSRVLADELMKKNFKVVSSGTDNHLILINLKNHGVTGLEAEKALGKSGIIVNKNKIPFDQRGARNTSGIRIGTSAITTRGATVEDVSMLAELIHESIIYRHDYKKILSTTERVKNLCAKLCRVSDVLI